MRQRLAPQGPVPTEELFTPTAVQAEIAVTRTRAATSTSFPTPIPASPTPLTNVSIAAVDGNLYVRRGPGLAFDPIGVLMEGQEVDALGRDVLSEWVKIAMPDQADQTGWVSLQTRFSQVDGDLTSLPVIKPEIWPVASYLRNCTDHQMYVLPAEIVLPSLAAYPENEVWVYPGSYTVYDLDHPAQPGVADVQLREGLRVDITVDGNGEKSKCP